MDVVQWMLFNGCWRFDDDKVSGLQAFSVMNLFHSGCGAVVTILKIFTYRGVFHVF